MFISSNHGTLETMLVRLYSLIEYDSAMYLDDLGYKWYELNNVLEILNISDEEYINGVYLMEIGEKTFISEEGINLLLLEYDNEYQDDLKSMLASEVIPDIKNDSVYISDNISNSVRNIMIDYQVFVKDKLGNDDDVAGKIKKNVEKKNNRKEKVKNRERRNKNLLR